MASPEPWPLGDGGGDGALSAVIGPLKKFPQLSAGDQQLDRKPVF